MEEQAAKVRCQRMGCDVMFSPDDNPDDSCQYHDSGVGEHKLGQSPMANCLSNFDLDGMTGKKCVDFLGQAEDHQNWHVSIQNFLIAIPIIHAVCHVGSQILAVIRHSFL
ncbi:unnamed protein product, partial [Vitis vinifera]